MATVFAIGKGQDKEHMPYRAHRRWTPSYHGNPVVVSYPGRTSKFKSLCQPPEKVNGKLLWKGPKVAEVLVRGRVDTVPVSWISEDPD